MNEKAFEELNEDTAYWLGYILFKGYLTKCDGSNCYKISVRASKNNKGHLEKLRHFLQTDKKVMNDKITGEDRLVIFNKNIFLAIESFGIRRGDKQNIELSDILKLNSHFWRGALDANGTVSYLNTAASNLEKPKRPRATIRLGGSYYICRCFLEYCKSICPNSKPRFYTRSEKTAQVYIGPYSDVILCELYKECHMYSTINQQAYINFFECLDQYNLNANISKS